MDSLDTETARHFELKQTRLQFYFLVLAEVVLLLGIPMSIVGYVGCFSIVQGGLVSTGPLLWLLLEVALSVIRIGAWNPRFDDATFISFSLKLEADPPLPTFPISLRFMEEDNFFPLVGEREFLPLLRVLWSESVAMRSARRSPLTEDDKQYLQRGIQCRYWEELSHRREMIDDPGGRKKNVSSWNPYCSDGPST